MFHSHRIPFASGTRDQTTVSSRHYHWHYFFVDASSYIYQGLGHVVLSCRAEKQALMRWDCIISYHNPMPPILSKVCTFQKKKPPLHLLSPRCIVQSGSQSRFLKNKNKRNFPNTSRLTFLSKTKLCDASPMAVDYVLVSHPTPPDRFLWSTSLFVGSRPK